MSIYIENHEWDTRPEWADAAILSGRRLLTWNIWTMKMFAQSSDDHYNHSSVVRHLGVGFHLREQCTRMHDWWN